MATAVEGAPQPLTGSKLVLTGFMLALANFMVVLDLTIANVSVPHIAGGLAVSPSQGLGSSRPMPSPRRSACRCPGGWPSGSARRGCSPSPC
ncbi:hypothetical protein [Hankyongella ginsenosidimutans]|uniref:hypothetical protein n=1 Tax=Hankyongella ginsenosidimutans TaxID=1763828 RepID=UPI001FE780EE|nr:hypothetical protein [Hankyongella ginsenosidimutans]